MPFLRCFIVSILKLKWATKCTGGKMCKYMVTKKIISVLAVMCILFTSLLCITAFADDTSNTNSLVVADNSNIAPFDFTQIIKVGYFPGFTDFANDVDSLNNKGYGVEIFEKIQEVSDLEFEYIEIAGSVEEALLNGDIDLLAFRTKSEKKAEEFLYSQFQFGKTYVALMTEDASIAYADFDAIDGKTVATFEDNIANERLQFYCDNLGFSVELIYGSINNYMNLEADFYLGFSGQKGIENMNNVLDIGVHNLYLNSTFENSELMDKIDAIFYDVVITEGNFFLELEEKYLAENIEITHRGLMPDELETLKQRPLEVGYIAEYEPISFMNEQGEPDGAMVETLNYYAELYDFEVNYHPVSIEDPPEDYEEYDVLVSVYGDIEHIQQHFSATEPYYSSPMYAQVNLDLVNSTNVDGIFSQAPKVGVLPYGTLDFETFVKEYPGTQFVFYNDWYELLDDFDTGKLDVLMCTQSATTFAELYFNEVNSATVFTKLYLPMQFFINKDIEQEYIPIFNVMIDRMNESDYEAILEDNANQFLPEGNISFSEFFAANWHYFALILSIIVAGFIAIYAHGEINKKQALIESYNTEPLTGFMAPQYFRNTMSDMLKNAKPNEYELIAFDIDMFKNINTYFSADKGTAVILAMSEALKTAFAGTSAIISRRTAEQFLLFRRVNEGGEMRLIYENYLLPAIKANVIDKYNISMSFGNVVIDDPNEEITTIVGHVFAARKAGKSLHKTTFITFDKEMKKQYENKEAITFRMENALKSGEFFVVYQPKINFKTLAIGGAEALVRWETKSGDLIYPDAFIPTFEENGFIAYLDLYVLEEVCKFIKKNSEAANLPRISVNFSAHTVLAKNIVNRINDVVSLHKVAPEKLEFELTESAIESNSEKFLEVVNAMKKMGFAISIDDFGTGVSSLNRLSEVKADILKLDKTFLNLKDESKANTVVVTDIINMAKHLNMKVVAEGIETQTQALWLRGIGCDFAQGYYFDRPLNVDKFEQVLHSEKQYEIELPKD